jgi:Putative transposase/Transposase zinc-binding domain
MVERAASFRLPGPQSRAQVRDQLPHRHLRAMEASEPCRTEALGGQLDYGENGHDSQDRYHACTNRHCPEGQNGSANEWRQRQKDWLLPVPPCLVTFTWPASLRDLTRSPQKRFYNSLFRASAPARPDRALAPRLGGGKSGMVGVLPTWTRALPYHPHGHDLVPAGGLAAAGRQWLPSRENFLVPIKALSLLFRAKVREALRQTPVCALVPNDLWAKDGVGHCEPVGRGAHALHYWAPSLLRVAISNHRSLTLAEGQVTFHYRESQTGAIQVCTVTAAECIRRCLPHGLPDHVVKVRDYGLCGPGNRDDLKQARPLLGGESRHSPPQRQAPDSPPQETTRRCPQGASVLQRLETLRPNGWGPLKPGP